MPCVHTTHHDVNWYVCNKYQGGAGGKASIMALASSGGVQQWEHSSVLPLTTVAAAAAVSADALVETDCSATIE